MTPEGTAAMTKIVNTLLRRPDSVDFRKPLDYQSLGLDDYPRVIVKPMDLGTVKQNIERQGYNSVNSCVADIRLIWRNCKRYNGEGSDFYNLADRLSKQFEELVTKAFPKVKAKKRDRDTTDPTEVVWRAAQAKMMRQSINDVAADLVCPITQQLPFDPVMAEDGKIYERNAIVKWFSEKDRPISPSTGAVIGKKLLPAVQTKNTIDSLFKSGAIEGELATAWGYRLADEKKVKATRAKAEGGDGYAMFVLGAWYQHGERGLAEDLEQARTWFHRSAAARDPYGMASLGECLLLGEGGPTNTSLGLIYITDAAHLGSDLGAYLLGDAFIHGRYGLSEGRVLSPSTAKVQARFWLKKVVDGECEFKHLSDENLATATRWLDMQEELRRRRAAAAGQRRGDRPGG